jgi:hypothetical protein
MGPRGERGPGDGSANDQPWVRAILPPSALISFASHRQCKPVFEMQADGDVVDFFDALDVGVSVFHKLVRCNVVCLSTPLPLAGLAPLQRLFFTQ